MATTRNDLPGILLTHGYWHGAWCWNDVAARLTSAGRRVLAVDMAGHGLRARLPASATARPFDADAFAAEVSPLASVDLDEASDLLVRQIHDFAVAGPVVVVGHSYFGAVLTRAAQMVPDLVRHAVYVAAIMPASGVSAGTYPQDPAQVSGDRFTAILRGDFLVTGALRLDVGGSGDYRAALRETFYADVDAQVADAAIALLTPDAPAAVMAGSTRLTTDGWGSVPRTYVHCTQDRAVVPAVQRRMVREADEAFPHNPTTVVELESSHSPFLSQPEHLARAISAAR